VIIHRFTEIRAWQAARELVARIYVATNAGALARDFGLRDQIRRAAVSTMSNIAEGFARNSPADFARFLDMARASGCEVQSLLFVCLDAGYLTAEQQQELHEQAEKAISLISRFQDYLRSDRVREDEALYQP
jgi:four helix bundle protein